MPEPILLIFLINLNDLVYVYGRGGLAIGGAGEVLDLVKETLSVEEEGVDLKKRSQRNGAGYWEKEDKWATDNSSQAHRDMMEVFTKIRAIKFLLQIIAIGFQTKYFVDIDLTSSLVNLSPQGSLF